MVVPLTSGPTTDAEMRHPRSDAGVAVAEQLTARDTMLLELEDADASAHMHVGAVLVFEGRPPSHEALVERVGKRLVRVPRHRRQLVDTLSGRQPRRWWSSADAFDVAAHVKPALTPEPVADAGLQGWAGDYFSQRLDRQRSLWELVLLAGPESDGWALAAKTHHCLAADGGCLDALRLIADGAEARGSPGPRAEPAPLEFVRAALSLAGGADGRPGAAAAVGDARSPLAGCSLDAPLSARGRLTVERCSAQGLEGAGGAVDDVVLAAVTGGLRALLLGRGETPPAAGLRAMVPACDAGRSVARVVDLPVQEPDPLRWLDRLRTQRERATLGRTGSGQTGPPELPAWLPAALQAPFCESVLGRRLFDLTVTLVPGPSLPSAAFGCLLREAMPVVPPAAGHALGIAVLPVGDEVTICVTADRDAMPDAGRVGQGLRDAFAELRGVMAAA